MAKHDKPITVLWRRLDAPGHDVCRFTAESDGYALRGTAVFVESKQAGELRYIVLADSDFHTRRAVVSGFIGNTKVDLRIRVTSRQRWMVNGVEHPALAGCIDLDLGFTPATNLLPIRRLSLALGQEAQAQAAYLEVPRMRFIVLPQRYKRLSRTEYEYESPTAHYHAILKVAASGVVVDYPGIFHREVGN